MAWRSSGSTNATLVANLTSNGLIKSERVKQAMLSVGKFLVLMSHQNPTEGNLPRQSDLNERLPDGARDR